MQLGTLDARLSPGEGALSCPSVDPTRQGVGAPGLRAGTGGDLERGEGGRNEDGVTDFAKQTLALSPLPFVVY